MNRFGLELRDNNFVVVYNDFVIIIGKGMNGWFMFFIIKNF